MRFLLCLLLLDCIINSSGFIFSEPKGRMEPGDSLAYIGETVKYKCTAETTTPEQLFFILSNGIQDDWELTTESDNVTIVDTTIEASIFVDDSFSHTTNIICKHRKEDIGWLEQKLYAERPLKNVSNFIGYYLDYDQRPQDKSVFKWSNNTERYLNQDFIKIQVNFSRNGLPQNWSDTEASPTWDGENCEVDYYGENSIYFLITVSHKKESKRRSSTYLQPLYPLRAEALFKFDLAKNRKVGPVTNVRISEKLATSVKLVYDLPSYFRISCVSCNVSYQLNIIKTNHPEFSHMVVGTQENKQPIAPVEVRNLTAFTGYTLTVKVKDEPENPWSDPSVAFDFVTEEDYPLHGPVVTPTSYSVVTSCENNRRNVCIYWNPQSVSSLRGLNQGYNVSIGNGDSRKLRTGTNYECRKVPCDQYTDFQIYSINNVGQSLSPSVIQVQPQGVETELLPADNFDFRVKSVSINESNKFVISWNPDALQCDQAQKLYIYICVEADPKKTCFSDYQLYDVMACGTHNLTVDNLERNDLVGYALEESMGDIVGIHWTECIYQDIKPLPPSDLRTFAGEEPGTLVVVWSGQRCNKGDKVLIEFFNITLCPAKTDMSNEHLAYCTNTQVPSDKGNGYTFSELEQGHTYQVSLTAHTPSDQSDPAVAEGSTREPDGEVYHGCL